MYSYHIHFVVGLLSAGTSLGHSLIWTKNEDTNKWLLITYITAQEPVDILAVRAL